MKGCLIVSAIAISAQLNAQSNSNVPDNIRATNAIDALSSMNVSPGYMLYGISEASGEITGSVYLSDNWKITTLKLMGYGKELDNYQCKVNLYSNQIEVKINNVIKAIDGGKVESLTWSDENTSVKKFYRNANVYKINDIYQEGFLEVLIDGKIPPYKSTHVIIKKPDYSIALNVGSKSTRIIKEEIVYFAKGNELVNVKLFRNRKFVALFGELSSEVDKFVKDNSLKISVEADLVLIFEHFNQMVRKKE